MVKSEEKNGEIERRWIAGFHYSKFTIHNSGSLGAVVRSQNSEARIEERKKRALNGESGLRGETIRGTGRGLPLSPKPPFGSTWKKATAYLNRTEDSLTQSTSPGTIRI